jgi:hypothetical protein
MSGSQAPAFLGSRFLGAMWLLPSFPFSWRSWLKLCYAGVLVAAWSPCDLFSGVLSKSISPVLGRTSSSADSSMPFDPRQEVRDPLSAMEEDDACSRSPKAVQLVLPSGDLLLRCCSYFCLGVHARRSSLASSGFSCLLLCV